MKGVLYEKKSIISHACGCYGNDSLAVTDVCRGTLDAAQQTGKLSYDGYKEVWSDEFNGDSLNRADWNVETHERMGNNELQEYVDSDENIR